MCGHCGLPSSLPQRKMCVCTNPHRSDGLLAVQFHGDHADDVCFHKEKKGSGFPFHSDPGAMHGSER